MRRVRASCARPPFQLETFASTTSESATSARPRLAVAGVHPRSRKRFATEAVCCLDTPVISLPVSHDPRTRASTQFRKRRPCIDRARTALLDAAKSRRSGRPMPISTSVRRKRDRPEPGRSNSLEESIAALVNVSSARGVPTRRVLSALLLVSAKVAESNQRRRRSRNRARSTHESALFQGLSGGHEFTGGQSDASACRPLRPRAPGLDGAPGRLPRGHRQQVQPNILRESRLETLSATNLVPIEAI
jgi:hypothetical protein